MNTKMIETALNTPIPAVVEAVQALYDHLLDEELASKGEDVYDNCPLSSVNPDSLDSGFDIEQEVERLRVLSMGLEILEEV